MDQISILWTADSVFAKRPLEVCYCPPRPATCAFHRPQSSLRCSQIVSYDGEEFLLIEVEPLESGKMNPQKEGHRSGRYNIAGGAYLSEKKGRNRAVELFADGDSLIRAMVNLLHNAIQFSKSGTTTSICSNNGVCRVGAKSDKPRLSNASEILAQQTRGEAGCCLE